MKGKEARYGTCTRNRAHNRSRARKRKKGGGGRIVGQAGENEHGESGESESEKWKRRGWRDSIRARHIASVREIETRARARSEVSKRKRTDQGGESDRHAHAHAHNHTNYERRGEERGREERE